MERNCLNALGSYGVGTLGIKAEFDDRRGGALHIESAVPRQTRQGRGCDRFRAIFEVFTQILAILAAPEPVRP